MQRSGWIGWRRVEFGLKPTGLLEAFSIGHAVYNQRMVRVHFLTNSNPKHADERRGCVGLAEGEKYHYVNPPVQQNQGLPRWAQNGRVS
jgi:hypothetical protein